MLLAAAALASGCNTALVHGFATAFEEPLPPPTPWRYVPAAAAEDLGPDGALLARFAPEFVIASGEAEWNRIGTPTLRHRTGVERARVEPAHPALFAEVRRELVGTRPVLQLVYRVHFDQFFPTWRTLLALHRNAGLLVLVTVDEASERPLCVTTVHACGCWVALQPTTALAAEALPRAWPAGELEVHGETLAARLAVPAAGERYAVHLRSGTHRVHDVSVASDRERPPAGAPPIRALPLRPMAALRALPVEGRPGEHASFFYERGYLAGHVKGAFAPLEGLTLGLVTLDPRLGMDRDFGAPDETGARFSTSILPWKREATRLDRFGRSLEELGFRVAAFAPVAE
jgi:hypothetical protein